MSANAAYKVLSSEADSLIEQAEDYRLKMEKLPTGPEGDAQRAIYEAIIRDLLDRSRKLSTTVTSSASGS